jgi:hypothetical protein
MSEAISTTLNSLGLSGERQARLAALQEAGRKVDFVYHYSNDGRGSRQAANQFDEFHAKLKVFSDEGETPRRFAAALWDHLAPGFVGWRPDFIEGVEARELGGILTRMDQHIDARLGRAIPPEVRQVSQDVRIRFDDLLFAYESSTWRDTRTPGEVRDELVFVASFEEKIRNVLYGSAREVDLRRVIEDYSPAREAVERAVPDSAFEARAYGVQLAKISDLVERLRAAGVLVQAGLTFRAAPERLPQTRSDDLIPSRTYVAPERKGSLAKRQPASDADQYWRNVAQSASRSAELGRGELLAQNSRRGRSI